MVTCGDTRMNSNQDELLGSKNARAGAYLTSAANPAFSNAQQDKCQ